jgi:hypothetical protein
MFGHTTDLDRGGSQIHEEQVTRPRSVHTSTAKKSVAAMPSKGAPEKGRAPRALATDRGGLNTLLSKGAGDRSSPDLVTNICEPPLNRV